MPRIFPLPVPSFFKLEINALVPTNLYCPYVIKSHENSAGESTHALAHSSFFNSKSATKTTVHSTSATKSTLNTNKSATAKQPKANNIMRLTTNKHLHVNLAQQDIHFHLACQRTQHPGTAFIQFVHSNNWHTFIPFQTLTMYDMPIFEVSEHYQKKVPLFGLLFDRQFGRDIIDVNIYRYDSKMPNPCQIVRYRLPELFYRHTQIFDPDHLERSLKVEINHFLRLCNYRGKLKHIELATPNICISNTRFYYSQWMQQHYPARTRWGNHLQKIIGETSNQVGVTSGKPITFYATIKNPVYLFGKDVEYTLGTQFLIYCIAIYIKDLTRNFRALLHYNPPENEILSEWFDQIRDFSKFENLEVTLIRNKAYCLDRDCGELTYEYSRIGIAQVKEKLCELGITKIKEHWISGKNFTIDRDDNIALEQSFDPNVNLLSRISLRLVDQTNPKFDGVHKNIL